MKHFTILHIALSVLTSTWAELIIMAGRWVGILSFIFGFLLTSWGQQPFRTFTASSGQAFTGRVLSYEGQTFYIQGKDNKLYPVPFKQLSPDDQKYLIQVAREGKVPKGDPRKLKQSFLTTPNHFPAQFQGNIKWTIPGYPTPSAMGRDGRLYFRKDTKLISMDSLTMKKYWEIDLGERGGPVSMGGNNRLYISSSDSGKVFCMDNRDGKKIWIKEFGGGSHFGIPSIMHVPGKSNLLFFCPGAKNDGPKEPVYGIDASNGELLWTNEERLKKPYPPSRNNGNATIGPDGTVYVSNQWRYIWAFEGKTGKVKWEFNFGKGGFATYPVLGSDGTVFVGSWRGLYAINGKTGKKKWTSLNGETTEGFPVVGSNDMVFIGARKKKFFAVDGQSGTPKWEITLNGETRYRSSTLCSDGQLLIPTDAGLYSVDSSTGRKNWRLTGKINPVVGHRLSSDGTLYLSVDDTLYAIQTATGPDPEAAWPQSGYNGANTGFADIKQQYPLRIPEEVLTVRQAWEKKMADQPQALSIDTIAGSGTGNTDGIGSAASFISLAGFATDGKYLFASDHHGHAIRKIDLGTKEVTTLAGSGKKGRADGVGQSASFSGPNQMTYHNGKLYLADQLNHLIRSIDVKSGKVETIAGTGDYNSSVDGIGLSASFNFPVGIDCNGTHLFVTEILMDKIRMLELATGKVTTLAHSKTKGDRDGALENFTFDSPGGIAVRGSVLYFADKQRKKGCSLVRKIDLDSKRATTLPSHGVPLLDPHGLSLEREFLVVSDRGNGCILKFNLVKEEWSVIAGIPGVKGKEDGPIVSAELAKPEGCAVLGISLYTGSNTVRKVNLPPGYFSSRPKVGKSLFSESSKTEIELLKPGLPIPEKKQVTTQVVTGAIIIASLTPPIEIINLETKRKLRSNELKTGKVINQGYEIKVGQNGNAVLLFSNGTITTLRENTNLVISKFEQEEFSINSNNIDDLTAEPSISQTLIKLKAGELVVEVKKLNKKSNFEFFSPLGFAGIRGTRFRINLNKQEGTIISTGIIVTEGTVYCKPAKDGKELGMEFDLKAGEKVSYSSTETIEDLLILKPFKAEIFETNEIEAIVLDSRKRSESFSLKSLLKALEGINRSSNLAPKLNPFQRMRPHLYRPRK